MSQRAMTSRPRRPSPAVARRRRMVALAALLLVAVLAIWGAWAIFGGSGGDAGQEPSATATPAASTEGPVTAEDLAPTGAPSSSASPGASGAPTGTSAAPAAARAHCAPPDVRVTANLDAESYAPGVLPRLSLTLENTGAAPCLIDLGTAKQVFTITSGSDEIWVSTHCQQDPQSQLVELAAGQRLDSPPIDWVRERSTKDTCDGERPAAVAGGAWYSLTASLDGIPSEARSFVLE